jgi:hypothetical protein
MEAVAQTGPKFKRINVPWDATMQDSGNAEAGWEGSSRSSSDQGGCSHGLVQSRIHRLCATASMQSGCVTRTVGQVVAA